MKREKIRLEYLLNATSKNILWSAISTPTGLEDWFADKVVSNDKIVEFHWGKTEQRDAEIIAIRAYSFIRFRWLDDENERDYFEIKMNYNNKKIVIIDWGGVIESHKVNVIERIIKHFNELETENIVERYYSKSVHKYGTDNRSIQNNKWFESLNEEFNLNCTPEEFYECYIKEFDKVEYYRNVVDFAHSLKDRCKIGILSNLGSLDKQRLDKQVDLKQFDYVWLSFELKCRKPEEKIYKIVEKDCKLKPENILFIDDSKENIKTAQKLGWNTCNATGEELDFIKESVNNFLKI